MLNKNKKKWWNSASTQLLPLFSPSLWITSLFLRGVLSRNTKHSLTINVMTYLISSPKWLVVFGSQRINIGQNKSTSSFFLYFLRVNSTQWKIIKVYDFPKPQIYVWLMTKSIHRREIQKVSFRASSQVASLAVDMAAFVMSNKRLAVTHRGSHT